MWNLSFLTMIKSYWVFQMVGIQKEKFISINLFIIQTSSLYHYKRTLKSFFSDLLPTFIDRSMGTYGGMANIQMMFNLHVLLRWAELPCKWRCK